jgi:hypothetical protein
MVAPQPEREKRKDFMYKIKSSFITNVFTSHSCVYYVTLRIHNSVTATDRTHVDIKFCAQNHVTDNILKIGCFLPRQPHLPVGVPESL